jgi:hypothetical protein
MRVRLEAIALLAGAVVLTVVMTYPVAFKLDRVGRIETGDGQWSIWVVAWVAHALLTDPVHLFDANIFYPHTSTLAYAESNVVTGALAVPVYAATGNPYAAHNSVFLVAFVLAGVGAYLLVRHLTRSRPAAAVAAVTFAFCPHVFSHTAHIHLLMTGGLPFTLLALHRLVDLPTWRRALALAAALALTGLACGYYGVFAALLAAGGTVYYFAARRLWRSRAHYQAVVLAAVATGFLVLPAVGHLVALGEGGRPFRSLRDSVPYSANWQAYLASAGLGHRWMLSFLDFGWSEVLFPGFTLLALAAVGVRAGLLARRRARAGRLDTGDGACVPVESGTEVVPTVPDARLAETATFYAMVTAGSFWLSLGPKAGLYTVCYYALPVFSLLRAPARMGLVVVLGLAVLAGIGLAHVRGLLARRGMPSRRLQLVACALGLAALLEVTCVPLHMKEVSPPSPVYATLATLPRGGLVEMPFFWRGADLHRHTYYMRLSTSHWQPLVNGYSDYFPPDYIAMLDTVRWFPTREAFDALRRHSARYVVFHLNFYDRLARPAVLDRIAQFRDYLRPLASDADTLLFEIVAWPGGAAQ